MTEKREGKMQRMSGKSILTAAVVARSSARCERRVRIETE
jgi:hypothetical protein